MKNVVTDGQLHQRNALAVIALCAGLALGVMAIGQFLLGLGVLAGAICGFFIDPDLDHEWKTISEGRISRMFGKTIGKLFRAYWSPYEIMFEHRSVWSHGGPPPFGWLVMFLVATPIRILYAIGLPIVLLGGIETIQSALLWQPLFWAGLYWGWAAQDLVHWLRDYL